MFNNFKELLKVLEKLSQKSIGNNLYDFLPEYEEVLKELEKFKVIKMTPRERVRIKNLQCKKI